MAVKTRTKTEKKTEKGRSYAEYLVKKIAEDFEKDESESRKKQQAGKKNSGEDEGFVRWLNDLSKNDIAVVGGKGANLGEMYNSGMPVPPAFVVTAQAYEYFLAYHNLTEKIQEMIRGISIDNTEELEAKAKEIQKLIIKVDMPSDLQAEIIEAYKTLNIDIADIGTSGMASSGALAILKAGREPCFVAVRSSATTEDLSTASFAGQQETFLNIKGNAELIESVKRCFASLFTARAIYYRERQGFEHEKSFLAVVVQKMINSEKSGVIFTINPATNQDEIVIESAWGLGEGIVSGAIKPDHYVLDKKTLEIKSKEISKKEAIFTRTAAGKTVKQPLHESKQQAQVLTESEIKKLGNHAIRIEEHYNHPQDIEFAIESGNIYIVQTRPVTTSKKEIKSKEIEGEAILQGLAASPGIASGVVKIVRSMDDLSKVKQGDILVTEMTNPDMVVTMQRAAAIITDEGGATAHAAIVSREMGIPCVVGTKTATTLLEEGQSVTVSGFAGKVYKGILAATEKVEIKPIFETKTRIKVIIDLPDFAERAAGTNASGVGLLRLEGIIAGAEKHPLQYLREKKTDKYKSLLLEGIKKIVQYFPKQPAWIRTSDIRSDEFQHLNGAPKVEINPMLGMHGIRESLKYPDLLKAELQAVKEVASQGFNLGVMLPQVISVEELKSVKKLWQEIDMPAEVQLGVMIETPAAVQIIDSLCKEGIGFISFGTNDLTQYTLAIDRGNEDLQGLYNEMHPAVLSQISQVIKTCKKYSVETSICGQAGSKPEMARFLVQQGIDSISINADAAHDVSKIIAELESKLEQEEEQGEQTDKQEKAKEETKQEEEKTEEAEEKEPAAKEEETAEEKEEVRTEEIMPENAEDISGAEEISISEDEAIGEADEREEKEKESEGIGEEQTTDDEEGLDIF